MRSLRSDLLRAGGSESCGCIAEGQRRPGDLPVIHGSPATCSGPMPAAEGAGQGLTGGSIGSKGEDPAMPRDLVSRGEHLTRRRG